MRLADRLVEVPLRRVGPDRITAALTAVADFSPYFAVDFSTSSAPLMTCAYADHDVLLAGIDSLAAKLGTTERRVAASTLHFGIAARLWSLTIGALAAGAVVPDLGRLRYRLDGCALRLVLPDPSGWTAPGDEAVRLLVHTVIDSHLRPLQRELRAVTRVAEGLLWGNVASALDGAVRVVAGHRTAYGTAGLAAGLLATPALAGTLGEDGKRRSCCLYYRVPGGGACGDCPLGESPRCLTWS